jgi:adenine-specific DNA methylase
LISKYLIIFITLLSCLTFACNSSATTFNSSDWKAAKDVDRHIYVNDLLSKGILIGKTKSEVIDLLGKSNPYTKTPDTLEYVIKFGGLGFDSVQILEIKFSEKGIVSSTVIRAD